MTTRTGHAREPTRHSASAKNRRKAHHHVRNAVEEAKFVRAEVKRAADRLVDLTLKTANRLKSEMLADKKKRKRKKEKKS